MDFMVPANIVGSVCTVLLLLSCGAWAALVLVGRACAGTEPQLSAASGMAAAVLLSAAAWLALYAAFSTFT